MRFCSAIMNMHLVRPQNQIVPMPMITASGRYVRRRLVATCHKEKKLTDEKRVTR